MAAYASVASLREYLDQVRTDAVTAGTDTMLGRILDRATGMINNALAAGLGLAAFAFATYGAAATQVVASYGGVYLTIPAHQAGSATLVEYQTGYNPLAYQSLAAGEWNEDADGRLYRPGGWGNYTGIIDTPRYRVTAIWGYGPAPDEIVELTLELAVNIWRSRAKGSFSEYTGAMGGGAMRVVGGLTAEQHAVLDALIQRYRMVVC